ncbi:hypothetical protein ACYE2N_01615 [Flavobacterium sp. MAHUQ-51]|uniref:hypothetical protein n=1 Tax=Flavobacterium sp. GCM10022190 TaxID=3252639 RepID=UPI00361AE84E
MGRLQKIAIAVILLLGFTAFWYWADDQDYFQGAYNDLTIEQKQTFEDHLDIDNLDIYQAYRKHFFNKEFAFPRQQVSKIKLFKNTPIVSIFTGKTLKQSQIDNFI